MAIIVSKEEKILIENRHKQFVYLLDKYKVKTRKLALLTGIDEHNLSSYKSGKMPITESVWVNITKGFELLDKELAENRPNIEVNEYDYVAIQLTRDGNVVIKKKKIKDIDKYLEDLKLNGFDCTYTLDRDGDYVITDTNKHKPMVEKVIKPVKPVIEQDLSIIDKVRNMHKDSLVMHEEALKLQASTEDIVKSVDDMETKFTPATDEDYEKIMPGWRAGLPDLKKKLDELFPDDIEQIIITKEDIEEALAENSHYELPWEEEEELKVLSDQLLEKNGIKDKSDKQSFIEFIKLKFTDEELKGFVRGMTILSVFDDEYKDAAFYIEYYMRSWMDECAMKGA